MENISKPLVAADVDLRGLPFMPLYIERLQKSKAWLACKRRPELAFYMLNLWMRSWHEVPAASIEDDDDVLADAAGADHKTWMKIRDAVLRGWSKAPDGRLYHQVVAELAAEAWEQRRGYRERAAAAREAKKQKRSISKILSAPANDTDPVEASVSETETGLNSLFKGEGEGQREGERESPNGDGRAAARSYAFEGRVIKLTPKDYKTWKANFHGIPDIDAELRVLDEFYATEPKNKLGNWFVRCSTALNNKHQEHLARRPPVTEAKSRPQLRDILKDGKY